MPQSGGLYRFLEAVFRVRVVPVRAPLGDGTFAPFSRASLSPIAIACLRLRTVCPELLLSVPFFRLCMAERTFFDADFPYFAIEIPPWIAVQTAC